MAYRTVRGTVVFGNPDQDTLNQIERCAQPPETVASVLCADADKGYSMPIGGVVAYDGLISPSGVGFDIACGNKAVRTALESRRHPQRSAQNYGHHFFDHQLRHWAQKPDAN